jgi:crossover junction endodeoxyribonuclease RuvC
LSANVNNDRIILGIDPGTNLMGYGIISVGAGKLTMLHYGVLKLDSKLDQSLRIKKIFEFALNLMETHLPDELAIEAPFFGKNVQSMLKLGRAQGVVMAAALHRQIPIFEYSPKKVKQSITGNGNASKEMVAAMVLNLLNMKDLPKYFDSTDALAIALCHYFQKSSITIGRQKTRAKKSSTWAKYIASNPLKVKQ